MFVCVRESMIDGSPGSLGGRRFGLSWPKSLCYRHSYSLGTAPAWRACHLKKFIRLYVGRGCREQQQLGTKPYTIWTHLDLGPNPCTSPSGAHRVYNPELHVCNRHQRGFSAPGTLSQPETVHLTGPSLDIVPLPLSH